MIPVANSRKRRYRRTTIRLDLYRLCSFRQSCVPPVLLSPILIWDAEEEDDSNRRIPWWDDVSPRLKQARDRRHFVISTTRNRNAEPELNAPFWKNTTHDDDTTRCFWNIFLKINLEILRVVSFSLSVIKSGSKPTTKSSTIDNRGNLSFQHSGQSKAS